MHSGSPNFLEAFIIILAVASVNFVIFGFIYTQHSGDSVEYNVYAVNLAKGLGYTDDGTHFSISREPGYPFFASMVFRLFGISNISALKLAQVFLLALAGFLSFLIFCSLSMRKAGYMAGIFIAVVPHYAYYSNLLLSEVFFTFLTISGLFLCVYVLKTDSGMSVYAFLGFLFACITLTRAYMIFFPVFFIAPLFTQYYKCSRRKVFIMLIAYVLCVSSWISYVYIQSGSLTITKGRQEIHLYTRSIRATLSYQDQVRYFISWLKRSASGGMEDEMLLRYDARELTRNYGLLINAGYAEENLVSESWRLLRNNIGHYLVGNIFEWAKMMFIEHMYPPVSEWYSRNVRAFVYIFIYGIFISGLIVSMRFWGTNSLIIVGSTFVLYHWLVLPFFDVIPRLNTPFLGIYFYIGLSGWFTYKRYKYANTKL